MKIHIRTYGNGKFAYRLRVVGHWVDVYPFDTEVDAEIACDLSKHYLRTVYNLDLPNTLDGEHFTCLAFSRRHVTLSDRLSVQARLDEKFVRSIEPLRLLLENHLANHPHPVKPVWEKFRGVTPEQGGTPALTQWVNECSQADIDHRDFSALPIKKLAALNEQALSKFDELVKPIDRALRYYGHPSNPRLQARITLLTAARIRILVEKEHFRSLCAALDRDVLSVENSLPRLETARPQLYTGFPLPLDKPSTP